MDRGVVLTSTNDLSGLLNAMAASQIPLLKVATGWPSWTDDMRRQACTAPRLLVRTVSGDGCQGYPNLDPAAVLAELTPWYAIRQDIFFELGNESNKPDSSSGAAYDFRYSFLTTLEQIRPAFPNARIVSPGLFETNQGGWWQICADVFSLADAIGFHAYDYITPTDSGQLEAALDMLDDYYPAMSWIGTEYGINDPATAPEAKAQYYANVCAALPGVAPQVAAMAFYHICDQPVPAEVDPQAHEDQARYALPVSALVYL